MIRFHVGCMLCCWLLTTGAVAQQQDAVRLENDSVTVRFVDTDIRAAIQALGRYLPKPVLTGNLQESRISYFETPQPIHRDALIELLRGLVEAQGFEFVETDAFLRVVHRPDAVPTSRGQPQVVQEPIRLFVVRLRHARAADVAATVNQLFDAGGAFSGSPGLSGGTLSDQLRRDSEPVREEGPGAPADSPDRQGANLAGPVTVVPDELTNSLLVRASQGDFDVLSQAIEQLDVRPLQVLIEVLIVEARKDRRFAAGIDAVLPPRNLEGGTIEGELTTAGLGDLVVRVMSLGKYQIDALLTAARQRGDVRIVSRPVLVASNNTESRLLVGSQRPFVSVSRSLPTDSPSRDQVVQFRDVGTKLTVRPTINLDGYVSLLIQQEISAATEETQFDAPVISTRETLTQVLVADEQTIVLGGLTDRQQDETRRGVPLLVDLPLIGGLFGGTTTRTIETELFLFITPTILSDDADADRVTRERLPEDVLAPGSAADTAAIDGGTQRGSR